MFRLLSALHRQSCQLFDVFQPNPRPYRSIMHQEMVLQWMLQTACLPKSLPLMLKAFLQAQSTQWLQLNDCG